MESLYLTYKQMDYGGIIWDPYLKTDVDRLECIQNQAARFITGDYKTREPGCITKNAHRSRITNAREKKNSPTSNIYVQSG
jgi:hypothetical protein